jgi:hypothetical protein
MVDWKEIIGKDRERVCDRLSELASRAPGRLSAADTRFLSARALELGTGFSTAFLCYALHSASRAGLIGERFEVVAYAYPWEVEPPTAATTRVLA